ncbi:MAG: Gfo/Idh/MocA family oxidoreductase [Armatimonadetes bacterium]|nr:Gfo/Idh/MocA family oxidoreductase [Armatimonadota bacterium]
MLNAVIVGAGGIARRHLAALKTIPSARIAGVVDTVPERAAAMAAAAGARAYPRLDDCLARADVVYLLTPPSTHRALAVAALESGRAVVCEKPLASNVADGEAMVEAAQRAGVTLITAFNMRFRKGFSRLKEMAAAGQLGEITSLWSQRLGGGVPPGYNWRTDPELLCGMSVESLSHDIDLLSWIGGEVRDVRAIVRESRADRPGFDDNSSVLLGMRSGASAVIHASWSSHLETNSRGVVGTLGTAMVEGPGLWESRYFRLKTAAMPEEWITVLNDPLDQSSYTAENEHFIECLERGSPPSVSGADGLRALRVSHAILESSRTGCVIAVES